MDYSYNDILRKNICKTNLEDSIIYFESLSYEAKEKVIDIMLLDYYKLQFSLKKECSELFECSKDELYKKCIYEVDLLVDLLEATYRFNNMSFFNKCTILEEMNFYNQDIKLMKISKMHLLDKITYQITDELDSYKEYYSDFKEKTSTELTNLFVFILSLRIKNMKKIDLIKYKKNILEILKVYYKWKLFIKDHDGEYLLNPEDKAYINIIEYNDIDTLLNLLEENVSFLPHILGEYLHYTTENIEIKEDIVDEHLSKNASKTLKKKFDIK